MRIVVATDSFKGTLTASEAASAIREGILDVLGDASILIVPMADGGEGTVEAIRETTDGIWVPQGVEGPLPGIRVEAGWLATADPWTGALVEMASASGLGLLPQGERNPLRTTTWGTGELIRAAADAATPRIWLAVGGSATVDGGTGAAAALGWRFLNVHGVPVVPGGGGLRAIRSMVPPGGGAWDPEVPLYRTASGSIGRLPSLTVLRDVESPLLGDRGAAHVFGPQKGADPQAVGVLEAGLENLSLRIREDLGFEVKDLPGAGAAGGLGAGAAAFFGATLVSGVDWVAERVGLREALAGADWLVTGEGQLDSQSLEGKVVWGVSRQAKEMDIPVAVIAGRVALPESEWRAAGIEVALAASGGSPAVRRAAAELARSRFS